MASLLLRLLLLLVAILATITLFSSQVLHPKLVAQHLHRSIDKPAGRSLRFLSSDDEDTDSKEEEEWIKDRFETIKRRRPYVKSIKKYPEISKYEIDKSGSIATGQVWNSNGESFLKGTIPIRRTRLSKSNLLRIYRLKKESFPRLSRRRTRGF